MTVPSEISRSERYQGNGVTTVFPFNFKILDSAHIQVLVGDGRTENALILEQDYTVQGITEDSGSVTLSAPLAYGKILVILRRVPFVQETDLENQGAFYAETHEDAFDYLTMQTQELKEKVDRSIVIPPTSDLDPSDVLNDILNAKENAERAEAAADRSENAADRAEDAANNIVIQGKTPIFATTLSVPSLSIPLEFRAFETQGYSAPGDGGGAHYKRVATEPTHAGKIQSGDGSWWEMYDRVSGAYGRYVMGVTALTSVPINYDMGETATVVAIGYNAMRATIQVKKSIAIGTSAMENSRITRDNIAIGDSALKNVQSVTADYSQQYREGTRNIAIGGNALYFNETGYNHIAIGRNSGQIITTGHGIVALGANAVAGACPIGLSGEIENWSGFTGAVSTNYRITAVGSNALYRSLALNNTAIGAEALSRAISSENNTAVGAHALQQVETSGWINGYIEQPVNISGTYSHSGDILTMTIPDHGVSAGQIITLQLTTGGSATFQNDRPPAIVATVIDANTFTVSHPKTGGNTTGNALLVSRISLTEKAPSCDGNTALGYVSLRNLTNGNWNTAIGESAGFNIVTGDNNIAIGRQSMMGGSSGIVGNKNISIGSQALLTFTSGQGNFAAGYVSYANLTNGSLNIAIGEAAGYNITTGNRNVLIGARAMHGEAGNIGSNNSVIGFESAYFTHGHNNVTLGTYSLKGASGSVGNGHVAIGHESLFNHVSGSYNTALGFCAGRNNTTGEYNTYLGYNAGRYMIDGTDNAEHSNTVCLGSNARISGANQVQLGNNSTTTYSWGAVQNRSDARDKSDIRDTELGLNFIMKLRPVDFRWDYRDDYIDVQEDGSVIKRDKDGSQKRTRYHHGFIAQDIEKLIKSGIINDFGGFQHHSRSGGADVMSIGYEELIAPLVKAVQELSTRVDGLKKKEQS